MSRENDISLEDFNNLLGSHGIPDGFLNSAGLNLTTEAHEELWEVLLPFLRNDEIIEISQEVEEVHISGDDDVDGVNKSIQPNSGDGGSNSANEPDLEFCSDTLLSKSPPPPALSDPIQPNSGVYANRNPPSLEQEIPTASGLPSGCCTPPTRDIQPFTLVTSPFTAKYVKNLNVFPEIVKIKNIEKALRAQETSYSTEEYRKKLRKRRDKNYKKMDSGEYSDEAD